MPVRDLMDRRTPRPPLVGRIRGGITVPAKNRKGEDILRPTQTPTIVFTANQPEPLRRLAERYGGTPEQYIPLGQDQQVWRLVSDSDKVLCCFPFADIDTNLDQWWMLYAKGGLRRRCDGYDAEVYGRDAEGDRVTESVGCVCKAQWAVDHDDVSPDAIPDSQRECEAYSRLRVFIPETGLGVWELQTTSAAALMGLADRFTFWATVFGTDRLNQLPIWLTYFPRSMTYFDPKTKKEASTTKRVWDVELAQEYLGDEALGGVMAAALPAPLRALPAGSPPGSSTEREGVSESDGESVPEEARGVGGQASPSAGARTSEGEANKPGPQTRSNRAGEPPEPSADPSDDLSPLQAYREARERALAGHGGDERTVKRMEREFARSWAAEHGVELAWPPSEGWGEEALRALASQLAQVADGAEQVGEGRLV